ncbi:MAG TPA: DUF2231 domain-containing protein [Terriglobales bacterium]
MQSRARLFGHPIHQMLIVFPLGLLATAVAFDIVGLVQADNSWFRISFWMIAAGIIGGLLSAPFGLIDWLAIPSGTRAKTVGLWHGGGNLIVVLLFIVSWFLRRPAPQQPGTLAFVLSFVAVAMALVTGWLGGELVDRLGVGVDPNANVNAPSSLNAESTAAVRERRVA